MVYEVENLTSIAKALGARFPDLDDVMPLRHLGDGFRSLVVETAGGLVFRIGKNQAAAQSFALEARLLPILQSHLPITIPNPEWFAGPSQHFRFGVFGYPKKEIEQLVKETAALVDLHMPEVDTSAATKGIGWRHEPWEPVSNADQG